MLIQGIHHICIKCDKSEIEKVKNFYGDVLGMPIIRSWGEEVTEGLMFDTGAGLIEVFTNATTPLPQGAVRHFALRTGDVDKCAEVVKNAGYEVIIEPKDIVIQSAVPFPARIAFAIGPVGEEIEFFCEK